MDGAKGNWIDGYKADIELLEEKYRALKNQELARHGILPGNYSYRYCHDRHVNSGFVLRDRIGAPEKINNSPDTKWRISGYIGSGYIGSGYNGSGYTTSNFFRGLRIDGGKILDGSGGFLGYGLDLI